MKTPILYVLTSSESDLYLEELWVSLFSLHYFNKEVTVKVLSDKPTAERIKANPELLAMIDELYPVDVPEEYPAKERSRFIKTNIRNLIDGDFLFIDTDTVICAPLDEVDSLPVKNIGMVPELHGPFKNHLTYNYTVADTKRIFDTDTSDSPYWFNSGCMLVRDNNFTHEFFAKWQENWKYSAFQKYNSSDQRALLKTDHDYGYIIECIPDVYNAQIAMSIKWFYEAKIIHFWHFRKYFTPNMDFSPFFGHQIYRELKARGTIDKEIANSILHCKSAFRNDSMICGENEIKLIMSPVNTILWNQYQKGGFIHWFLKKQIYLIGLYQRGKNKILKLCKHTHQ